MHSTKNREYEHCKCICGGIIGIYDGSLRCERCYKTYALWKLDYDHLEVNPMTGWMFPMKKKESVNASQEI